MTEFVSYEIDNLYSLLIKHQVASKEEIESASLEEVTELESKMSILFPKYYKEFLLVFGRKAGFLFRWDSAFFDDLIEMHDGFHEIIKDDELDASLPKNALIIANFESAFDFIVCDGITDDPAVYRIQLGTENYGDPILTVKVSEHFTKYLYVRIVNADKSESYSVYPPPE